MENKTLDSIIAVFGCANYPAAVVDAAYGAVWLNDAARESFPFAQSRGFGAYFKKCGAPLPIVKGSTAVSSGIYSLSAGERTVFVGLADGCTLFFQSAIKESVLDTNIKRLAASDIYGNLMRTRLTLVAVDIDRAIGACDDPRVIADMISAKRNTYQLLRDTTNFAQARRFMSGAHEAHEVNCDLSELVRALCTACGVICPHIKMTFAGEPSIPCRVDVRLVEMALMNLLSNAATYTRDGNEISIGVKLHDDRVTISVLDKGLGIKPEVLPHVREPFFTRDPYNDGQETQAAGLGLFVADSAALLLGGELVLTSRFGEGTSALLSFTLKPRESEEVETYSSYRYLRDRFSAAYVGMCGVCELED